jgi:hypothetical protein
MNDNASLSVILCKRASLMPYLCKDVTPSGIFQFFFNLELLLGLDASGKNVTPTDVFQFFLRKKN